MAATNVTKQVEERAQDVQEKATGMAEKAAEKAKEAASNVTQKASDLASAAGQKAEDATAATGRGMRSMAETVRAHGPREGMLGSTASTLADTMERGGRYLEEEGLSGIAEDLANLIRRNPVPALIVGIGIGFLIARATSRS